MPHRRRLAQYILHPVHDPLSFGDGCESDDDGGTSAALATAGDAAQEQARAAVGEAMRDIAQSGLKGEARKAAATAAKEAAQEAAEEARDDSRGRGLAKGLSK